MALCLSWHVVQIVEPYIDTRCLYNYAVVEVDSSQVVDKF